MAKRDRELIGGGWFDDPGRKGKRRVGLQFISGVWHVSQCLSVNAGIELNRRNGT